MDEHQALPYLRETILFLLLAGILIPIAKRLKINQIIGFLSAGILVGPYGLGLWKNSIPQFQYFTFPNVEDIRPLADLGILFLMFMIGLELSAERLRSLYKWVFGAGTMQVLLCALAIGLIARFYGNRIEPSIVLGLVLALSSTAVVMQLLTEERSFNTSLGQVSFSILMLQDLAVVPIFILLDVLSKGNTGSLLPAVGIALFKAICVIALIYFLGRKFIRPFFRAFSGRNQPDVFMALTLLCSLGIAGLTALAGLSMALGAFLAGLVISETEFRHEVEIAIEPFKGLLMGLFFISVGMQIDWREIATHPVMLLLAVIGLFLVKGSLIAIVLRFYGFQWRQALHGGLMLGQGGEFAFIVISSAVAANLLDRKVGQFMMLVVSLSLFLTPLAAKAGRILSVKKPQADEQLIGLEETVNDDRPYVIIAGFGRVGRLLARLLTDQGIRFVAIDNDLQAVTHESAKGFPILFGNASQPVIWEKLNIQRAAAIILTMDQPISALHAVATIRRKYASLPILARARDEKHAVILKEAGADFVIPETLESALQLAAQALELSGMPADDAINIIRSEREHQLGFQKSR